MRDRNEKKGRGGAEGRRGWGGINVDFKLWNGRIDIESWS